MTKTIVPIFFARTRSFWLGIVPTTLAAIDLLVSQLTGDNAVPISNAIALVINLVGIDWTGAQIAEFVIKLMPLYMLIFAQQRGTFSGQIPRPYTASPGKERLIVKTIEDGKSAFEAGKAFGERLKAR